MVKTDNPCILLQKQRFPFGWSLFQVLPFLMCSRITLDVKLFPSGWVDEYSGVIDGERMKKMMKERGEGGRLVMLAALFSWRENRGELPKCRNNRFVGERKREGMKVLVGARCFSSVLAFFGGYKM